MYVQHLICVILIIINLNNVFAELNISSRKLDISRDNRRASFTGNVKVTFQDMLVKAGKIEVFYAEKFTKENKKNIDKLVISQNFVARKGKDIIKGKKAEYILSKEELKIFDAILLINNVITKSGEFSYKQKIHKIALE